MLPGSLIQNDGIEPHNQLYFPSGDSRTNYEATCKGLRTPRDDTKKFFIDLGVHKGGRGEELYALKGLDRLDKHAMLTPIVGATHFAVFKLRNKYGPLRNKYGPGVIELKGATFKMDTDGRTQLVEWKGGLLELDHESQPTLEIFFRDVELFKHKPIIPTLMHLSDAVADMLRQFRTFVETRN